MPLNSSSRIFGVSKGGQRTLLLQTIRHFFILACMLGTLAFSRLWFARLGLAAKTVAITAFGCTVESHAPELRGDKIFSPVRLNCPEGLEDREVFAELQQRRDDGTYYPVVGSGLISDVPGPVTGNETVMERTAAGWPVQCRPTVSTRIFRTAVKIRVGRGSAVRVTSEPSALPQDCFGDESEPLLSVDDASLAAACTAPVLPDEMVDAVLARTTQVAATPVAPSTGDAVANAMRAPILPESELPAGDAASEDIILSIEAVEQEFADCYNAGEFRRAASLLTDEAELEFVQLTAGEGFPENRFENPFPVPIELRISSLIVRDAREFPDGRVGAIVDWPQESNFHVYMNVDGDWRIADWVAVA